MRISAVESCKRLFVIFVKSFIDFVVAVVNLFILFVGDEGFLCGDESFCVGNIIDNSEADSHNDRRTDSAYVLRTVNGFDCSAGNVGKNLAGNIGECAAADKADNA